MATSRPYDFLCATEQAVGLGPRSLLLESTETADVLYVHTWFAVILSLLEINWESALK